MIEINQERTIQELADEIKAFIDVSRVAVSEVAELYDSIDVMEEIFNDRINKAVGANNAVYRNGIVDKLSEIMEMPSEFDCDFWNKLRR